MKLKLIMAIGLTGLFFACSETQEPNGVKKSSEPTKLTENVEKDSIENNEPVAETKLSTQSEGEYKQFLTDDLLLEIGKMEHQEMYDNGAPDFVKVISKKFTPPGWENEFAYCQLIFTRGEVREETFVVFKPNLKGELDDENYGLTGKEDLPCVNCELEEISIQKDETIQGVFIDTHNKDGKVLRIIKKMEYNFQELSVFWMDVN